MVRIENCGGTDACILSSGVQRPSYSPAREHHALEMSCITARLQLLETRCGMVTYEVRRPVSSVLTMGEGEEVRGD